MKLLSVPRIALILVSLLLLSCVENKKPKLIFQEDFNGDSLNEAYWNYELGDGCPDLCGWGNNECQVYTKENISLADGLLIIRASKKGENYFSGKITTQNKLQFTYGTIEVKAKLAKGKGLWPAIWLLGSNIDTVGWPACGEIDMMEYVGKNPHEIHTSLHTPASHGNTVNTKLTTQNDIEEGFHVYKTDWRKDAIKFYIDDQLVYTFSPEEKNPETWPFNHDFYLILNMAIGGNFGGPEVDDSIFPADFSIDYIKVYQ